MPPHFILEGYSTQLGKDDGLDIVCGRVYHRTRVYVSGQPKDVLVLVGSDGDWSSSGLVGET